MNPTLQRIITAPRGIVKRGLLGCYKFNEAAESQVLTDYSGIGKHMQNGSEAGVDTNDATFDGIGASLLGDDYFKALPFTKKTNELTYIIAYNKLGAGVGGYHGFISGTYGHAIAPRLLITENSDSLLFQADGTAGGTVSTPSPVIGVPVIFGVTYDSSGVISFYRNKNFISSVVNLVTIPTALNYFCIGSAAVGVPTYMCNGVIYYALVYDRALTPVEYKRTVAALIKDLASRGVTVA